MYKLKIWGKIKGNLKSKFILTVNGKEYQSCNLSETLKSIFSLKNPS